MKRTILSFIFIWCSCLFTIISDNFTIGADNIVSRSQYESWIRKWDAADIKVPSVDEPRSYDNTFVVNNQQDFDELNGKLRKISKPKSNVKILINGGTYLAKAVLDIGNTNISKLIIKGNGDVKIVGAERIFENNGKPIAAGKEFTASANIPFTAPHDNFPVLFTDLSDLKKNVRLSDKALGKSERMYFSKSMAEWTDEKNGLFRFKCEHGNMSEKECKNVYAVINIDWSTIYCKVIKIERGYIYMRKSVDDLWSYNGLWVNKDIIKNGQKAIKYSIMNLPDKKSVYLDSDDKLHIPSKYPKLACFLSPYLMRMAPNMVMKVDNLQFYGFMMYCITSREGAFAEVTNCKFRNCGTAVYTYRGKGLKVTNCEIANHTEHGVLIYDENSCSEISNCKIYHDSDFIAKRNTNSILSVGATKISNNTLLNSSRNHVSVVKNSIVEKNIMINDDAFIRNNWYTVTNDDGIIYCNCPSRPSKERIYIRYNIISGRRSDIGNVRGIMLDDGAYNTIVYGNIVSRIQGRWSIDSRVVKKEDSPGAINHNTNNIFLYNFVDDHLRLQGSTDVKNSGCYALSNVFVHQKPIHANRIADVNADEEASHLEGYIDETGVYLDAKTIKEIQKLPLGRWIFGYIKALTNRQ